MKTATESVALVVSLLISMVIIVDTSFQDGTRQQGLMNKTQPYNVWRVIHSIRGDNTNLVYL